MNTPIPSPCLPTDLQPHRYLTEKEVSALTSRAVQTLRNDRFKGQGFPYVKFERSVRCPLADVLEYMDSLRIDPEAAK